MAQLTAEYARSVYRGLRETATNVIARVRNRLSFPFWFGVVAHLVLWVVVVNFDSTPFDLTCSEVGCWVLFVFELPVSLWYIGYVSTSAATVSFSSLVLGSLWWGLATDGLYWFAQTFIAFARTYSKS